jgi:glycerophosphoryl diester phosphodiesterase
LSSLPARPLLYSHRGASKERPENTLPSFRRAAEIGVDAFETDAHMTADGHVVVSHDPTGARMCGVAKEIRKTIRVEVQSWDAGLGFVDENGARPFAGGECRIPTLAQLLAEFPDTPLNIDIKQSDPPMVPQVLEVVRRYDAEQRVTLASFSEDTMREVRRRGYRGPTALAKNEILKLLAVPRWVRRFAPIAGTAAQLPVRAAHIDLSRRRIIDKCHALGLRVDYWTINDPQEAQRLLDAGADGIMTDDPAAIAPVFERLRRAAPR